MLERLKHSKVNWKNMKRGKDRKSHWLAKLKLFILKYIHFDAPSVKCRAHLKASWSNEIFSGETTKAQNTSTWNNCPFVSSQMKKNIIAESNFASSQRKVSHELNFADGKYLLFAVIKFHGWPQKHQNLWKRSLLWPLQLWQTRKISFLSHLLLIFKKIYKLYTLRIKICSE